MWEDEISKFDHNELMARREDYEDELPMQVGVLTCGVDCQDDRVEIELVGWGKGQESWAIEWKQFYGNLAELDLWEQVDDYLLSKFAHASGALLPIACVCIDSGGHHTQDVYRYCKGKSKRRIFAIKGSSSPGRPLTSRPSRSSNTARVPLSIVGTDTAKDAVYARLKITEPGPGYCHFSNEHDAEYFKQLTAEVVETTYVKGHSKRRYIKAKHARNEVLDCRVYAYAALDLLKANLDKCVDRLIARSQRTQKPAVKADPEGAAKQALSQEQQDVLVSNEALRSRRRKNKSSTTYGVPKRRKSGWMKGM